MSVPEPRPHPFDLVFGDLAVERFPAIDEAVGDATTLDAFLMATPAVELLHDLRPDEGLGEAVDDFVAFVHAAWRFRADGGITRSLDAAATRNICDDSPGAPRIPAVTAQYIQVAPRLVWGRLADGESWEPLDGWFVVPTPGAMRVVACFGLHPSRPGLSVVAAEAELLGGGEPLTRADGTPPFSPLMEGGDRAGLHAVQTIGELRELAWRAINLQSGR